MNPKCSANTVHFYHMGAYVSSWNTGYGIPWKRASTVDALNCAMECGHVLAMVSFVWSCLVLSCLPLSCPVPYRPFPSRPVPTSVVLSCLSFSRWTRVSRNKRCRPIIFVRNRFPLLLSISQLGSPTTRETLHTHKNKTKPKQNFNQEFSTSQNYILEQEATVNRMDGAHH